MENFVVSARKYRPATFDTVVGQKHITETLKNAISRGQVAHAYLFTGPRGVGKTTCARIFAKAINCLGPSANNEACGECESCRSFDDGRSFNIHELDAASNNSVDDIRALNDKVRIAPQIGRYSIYIIDEVHMLSTGAFNAFLKTLEEPPSYAVFILATTEKHKILPTILSRCQGYDFNRIRVEDIVEYIAKIAQKEGVTYDDESLHIIAQKADGGMRDALSTFDRVVSFCGTDLKYEKVAESIGSLDFNTYFTTTDYALGEDYPALLTLLDQIMSKGFDPGSFVSGLGDHMRNLLVAKDPKTASLLEVTGSLAQRYATQAASADVEFLFNAINLLTKTDSTYKSATNRRLHVEMALIKLCSFKKKDSIAENYPLPQIIRKNDNNPAKSAVDHTDIKVEPVPTNTGTPDILRKESGEIEFVSKEEIKQGLVNPAITENKAETGILPPAGSAEKDNPGENSESPPVQSGQNKKSVPVFENATMRRSITNISIAGSTSVAGNGRNTENAANNEQAGKASGYVEMELSASEVESRLNNNYEKLIGLWNSRNRPRIATALTVRSITGNRITIIVPDQVLADEIGQNKWQIEEDIRQLMGCRVMVETEIRYVETVKLPVSIEKKLQFLVDKNAKILKLRDELELTI